MRLINAITLQLEDYFTRDIPAYAILSHTWGSDEVTYQQFTSSEHHDSIRHTAGYRKIEQSCILARKYDLQYIWIDTCCIDKSSSAELTESINSMFRWYDEARICFAFLEDVPSRPVGDITTVSEAEIEHWFSTLAASRWFRRGWTLQELLAPRDLDFVSSLWELIGSRNEEAERIATITGIDKEYLVDLPPQSSASGISTHSHRFRKLKTASVAQRMSWASNRETTRQEDMAYCLIGLFGISMPLIYGEGANAFLRLQEEIARTSSDATLLAWNLPDTESTGVLWPEATNSPHSTVFQSLVKILGGFEHPWCASTKQAQTNAGVCGFLAPHPSCFRGCGRLHTFESDEGGSMNADWSLASNGLTVNVPVSENERPYILLPCYSQNDPTRLLSIPVTPAQKHSYLRSRLPVRYAPSESWHQWSKERVLLSTRKGDTSQHASKGRDKREYLWIRSIPSSLRLHGGYVADRGWTEDCCFLPIPRGDPATTFVTLHFRTVDPGSIGDSFLVTMRAPAGYRTESSQAWRAWSDTLGPWPWNLSVLENETALPAYAIVPASAFIQKSCSGTYKMEDMPRDIRLKRSHISLTISLACLGDRRVFAVDIYRSHSLLGLMRWKLAHQLIPAAVRILPGAILSMESIDIEGLPNQRYVQAAFLSYLRMIRRYSLKIFCMTIAIDLAGYVTGSCFSDFLSDFWRSILERLVVEADPYNILVMSHKISVLVFLYRAVPIISVFYPSSSEYIRRRRWPIAILLGMPLFCVSVPQNVSFTILSGLWMISSRCQTGWWQNLGYKDRVPSTGALNMSYCLFEMLKRTFLKAFLDAVAPEAATSKAMPIWSLIRDICFWFGNVGLIIMFDLLGLMDSSKDDVEEVSRGSAIELVLTPISVAAVGWVFSTYMIR